ncbi:MAG TPA: hypothetical protein VMV19_11435 [Xanthobacteraceae bacterium]|nr:hypothetical protein [Xanthobacteraceae bacterium]
MRKTFGEYKAPGMAEAEPLGPTDGEINFFWSFIQGSLMNEETWFALVRGCGFCERHAWIHIGIEMSFRGDYLLGPTILYGELIDRAVRGIGDRASARPLLAQRRLQATGPCFVCALSVKGATAGACPQSRLKRGRDDGELRAFAKRTEPLWQKFLCSECLGQEFDTADARRCRRHLLAAFDRGTHVDFAKQKTMLEDLSMRLARHQASFIAGGEEADDLVRAALIAAIGWCSGWRSLLARLT